MPKGRPLTPVVLTDTARAELESMSRSRSLPHALVQRAQIILAAADGQNNREVSQTVGVSYPTVLQWRKRYLAQGLMGLYDEPRPGAPRTIDDETIAELVRRTLETKPKKGTHWTCRSMAEELSVSRMMVQRVWTTFGLKPHRQKSFALSTDPWFVDKVRDIVGLYLNPPENALVLCVDEKSQIQALERAQPILPMGLGYLEGVTHNYIRHGTTTLFAALEVATGKVITQCKPRHRHQEFLQFLRHIDANVPDDLEIHLILDNYSTHKHPKVKQWLAKRPRYHVHYTPTYSSWLNQVEIWFGIITRQAIRRGSHRKVKELIQHIETFVEQYNPNAQPFAWTATADSILKKIERLCKRICGT